MRKFARLVLLLVVATQARADFADKKALLKCTADKALINFGFVWNGGGPADGEYRRLDSSLSATFKDVKGSNGPECRLANGKAIAVAVHEGTSYAHGAGGANPSATFDLSIGGKQVYFGKLWDEGGEGKTRISAIVYDGASLKECHPPYDDETKVLETPATRAKDCVDVSSRLTAKEFKDADELAALKTAKLKEGLDTNLSPFCKDLARGPLRGSGPELVGFKFVEKAKVAAEMGTLDIDNNGKKKPVVRVGDTTHYFDGDYLVVFDGDPAKAQKFVMTPSELDLDDAAQVKKIETEYQARVIKGTFKETSPRYTHITPFTFKGKTYLFLTKTTYTDVPYAKVSTAAGQDVCVFSSRELFR